MRGSYSSTRVMLDGGRGHRESGSPTCPVDSQDNGGVEHRGKRPTGTDGCFEEYDGIPTTITKAGGLDISNAGFVDHTTMEEIGMNAQRGVVRLHSGSQRCRKRQIIP